MKKSILAILVLICGISIVQAETAQHKAKQPSFFIPEDALKAKSKPVITSRYFIQNVQNTGKSVKKSNRSAIKLTASKLSTSVNTKQPKKFLLTAHKNTDMPTGEVTISQNTENTPPDDKIAANIPASNPSEQMPDNTTEVSQTQTPTVEPDVFQIILNEYYQDTESLGNTRTYQNERLQNVIASFVDEDHVLN